MKKIVSMVLLLPLLFCSPARAKPYMTFGAGLQSCGRWVAEHKTTSVSTGMFDAWLGGFMTSGLALMPVDTSSLPNDSMYGFEVYVSNYCIAHPLERVDSAAAALLLDVSKRLPIIRE